MAPCIDKTATAKVLYAFLNSNAEVRLLRKSTFIARAVVVVRSEVLIVFPSTQIFGVMARGWTSNM